MAAEIAPGMWVECIGAPPGTPKELIVGTRSRGVYRVAAVGEWYGAAWLLCEGHPHPGDIDPQWRGVPGWDARGFRPIWRGDKSLIETLLEPLPEGVEPVGEFA